MGRVVVAVQKQKEEYAIVLDFLQNGYPFDNTPSYKKTAIVQMIGRDHLSLLEAVPKKDIYLKPHEEVYIGDGKRDQIHHVNGKLDPNKLTATARAEIEYIVNESVNKNPQPYVDFFNKAQPLSTRMHSLELLPGLGKKHMWEIIEAREEKPFESFEDIKHRVKLLPDPKKIVIKRILSEILGEEKYLLFVER
jgi:putative nucleotide binding protein